MTSWFPRLYAIVNYIFGTHYEEDLIVCDEVPGLGSFESERYMGRWFSIWHAKDMPFQSDDDRCVTALYSNLDGIGFDVYNSYENDSFRGRSGINGTGKCFEQDPNGQCHVSFWFWNFWTGNPGYKIVDTDYESYTMVYNCDEDGMAYLWFMARTPEVSADWENMMFDKARIALPNFDFDNLVKDYQGGKCQY